MVIVSLLSIFYIIHSSLGSYNQVLYPNKKISVSVTLKPHTNQNIDGIYQLLPKTSSAREKFVLQLT